MLIINMIMMKITQPILITDKTTSYSKCVTEGGGETIKLNTVLKEKEVEHTRRIHELRAIHFSFHHTYTFSSVRYS